MEIVSLANFLPQVYQGRSTVRPAVQLSKEPPTQRSTKPSTQKPNQPPTQLDEDSDDEKELDIFGGRRPDSLPQDAGPEYETQKTQRPIQPSTQKPNQPPIQLDEDSDDESELDIFGGRRPDSLPQDAGPEYETQKTQRPTQPSSQKPNQPPTQLDEDSDDEREFDIFGGRRPGSLPQDAGPEYETENSGSGADNVGRGRDPAAGSKHDLHAEAAGSGATKSTDTPAGFLPSWPQQQPREKRPAPAPAKIINRPTYDNVPKSYNRRSRRAGAVPVIPPVRAASPVFVNLDGASVAVYLEGLPPGTSKKLLFPEIRGGAIHSVTMFSTKLPNERTIISKQAVVYFMSPQSADRFVASHDRNPIKVLGYRINIGRTVPPTKLTPQLRRFPAGYSRCLRITNLPEYKYSAVYISRWIDDVLGEIVYESLAFDHQSSTAVFQFLSVEHASTFKTNFIETKEKDMDWKNVRIDFFQDPTATLI
ncbi:hypothetical protein BDD12DRAFT_867727 [Trichophaea hybrida]|nr:hypothetical protein BDD12DRAFT_867727 [Trichophaea hybrida]